MSRTRSLLAAAALLLAAPALHAQEETPTPSPADTAAVAATPEATETPAPPAAEVAKPPTLPFDLHGGVLLWQYQPFLKGAKPYASIYAAYLTIDKSAGGFGFHLEPRFRDYKLRPFFNSNVWLQEAYVFADCPGGWGKLKVGKLYTRFGYFWDGSFYGNLPYFDGIKLDPDIGGSLEGAPLVSGNVGVEYALQYFANDGLTNGSLAGRDSLSEGGIQRNEGIVRVAPFYRLGADGKAGKVQVGASYQSFRVEEPAATPNQDVSRFEVDANASYANARVFFEYISQNGRQVLNFPFPAGSKKNEYYWAGVGYTWKAIDLRYNVTQAKYKDTNFQQIVHNPGVVITVSPNLSVMLEYAYWSGKSISSGGRERIVDRSGNVILIGSF